MIDIESLPRIIPIGTAVHVGDGDIPGTVTSVSIRGMDHRQIKYEVAYWDGRTHKEVWTEEWEMTLGADANRQAFGFRNGKCR